jgi:voltage-gated potassium channel
VSNPLRRFRLPGVLLAGALAYGTLGYLLIERWSLLDSFYMTITTISTVGFSEVHPLDTAGRLFTSTLIIGGVGTMLYAFGVFAETLSEGHFIEYRRMRRVQRRIDGMRGHFIVCGYGRIGTRIVTEFDEVKRDYVVVDNNPEAIGRLKVEERVHIEGDAAAEEILLAAGIARAKGLISAVDSDERSVYITLAARALNPDLYIVARAGQPASIRRLELAGADRVVSPYLMAGHRIAEVALRPALVDVLDNLQHGNSENGVQELLVGPSCPLIGKSVGEAGLLSGKAGRLLAVRRAEGTLLSHPDTQDLVLAEGDLVVILGTNQQLAAAAAVFE